MKTKAAHVFLLIKAAVFAVLYGSKLAHEKQHDQDDQDEADEPRRRRGRSRSRSHRSGH